MSNLMSSHRDEDKNFKNVEHFSPSLSEVRETADILIDSTADVCLQNPKSMVSNFQEFQDKTSGGLHEGSCPLIRPNAGNVMGNRDILSDKWYGQGRSCIVSHGMKDESPSDRPPEPHDGLHDTKCAFGSHENIENDTCDRPPVTHDNEFDDFEYEVADGSDGIASSPQGAQGFKLKDSP